MEWRRKKSDVGSNKIVDVGRELEIWCGIVYNTEVSVMVKNHGP